MGNQYNSKVKLMMCKNIVLQIVKMNVLMQPLVRLDWIHLVFAETLFSFLVEITYRLQSNPVYKSFRG